MKTIFPKEIIDHTTEAHFAKFNTNIKIIYLLVIVLLIAGFLALPIVNVPITQQGRGTIRSLNENNNVISAIYGQIAENRLHENRQVIKSDTLLILNVQKLDNELKSLSSRLDVIMSIDKIWKCCLVPVPRVYKHSFIRMTWRSTSKSLLS